MHLFKELNWFKALWNWRRNARERREAREEAEYQRILDVVFNAPPQDSSESESSRMKQMG